MYGVLRTEGDSDQYLTTYQTSLAWCINSPDKMMLEDKLYFNLLLEKIAPEHAPIIYGFIQEGKVYSIDDDFSSDRPIHKLSDLLQLHGKLVVKPVSGGGGKGIHILCSEDNPNELESKLDRDEIYIITEFIEQGNYIDSIYADATNTIRILTLNDPTEKSPYIASAVHRIGTRSSAPVDNFGSGGLCCGIELNSGTLLKGAPKPNSGEIEWARSHPDTDAQIEGVSIPNWDELCESICDIASFFNGIPIIAWDIVVTSDDSFRVIEANANKPGFKTIQMHEPLLKNQKNLEFFESHGVI